MGTTSDKTYVFTQSGGLARSQVATLPRCVQGWTPVDLRGLARVLAYMSFLNGNIIIKKYFNKDYFRVFLKELRDGEATN